MFSVLSLTILRALVLIFVITENETGRKNDRMSMLFSVLIDNICVIT